MSGQITIKDIAEILHIAPSTVSRALQNHPDISQQTKDAVIRLADQLDYRPNSIASGLRKSKTFTLGVVVPEIIHFFFSSVISGIEEVAYREGYRVIICQSNERYEREVININTLLSGRVDGILISMSKKTLKYDHFEQVISKGLPLVFFDRICEGLHTPRIMVDDYIGAFNATNHLLETGCRRIAHFAGFSSLLICRERRRGFIEAHKTKNIPYDEDLIVVADDLKEAIETTNRLMQGTNPPDAIFAVNDNAAVGALIALKKLGVRVPEQVAIVGFTDDPTITTIVDPPLSSVEQPAFEMGKAAATVLLNSLERNIINEEPIILNTRLVIRESSMKEGVHRNVNK